MDPVEAGRRGGEASAGRKAPYLGTILDAMDAAALTGSSWRRWRTLWRASFALEMSEIDLEIYRAHTQREVPPTQPVKELWIAAGRGSGKSRMAALAAVHRGITFDGRLLSRGERGLIAVIAADRDQAKNVLGYIKGFFEDQRFAGFVRRSLATRIDLKTDVTIEVRTASFRTIRGFTLAAAIADEAAFWRDRETSMNPDYEILHAVRPGLARIPGSMLICISSPYGRRGELYRMYERHFGRDGDRVLYWNSDTASFNPTIDPGEIEAAFEDDPSVALSEWGQAGRVEFRRDVEAFLDPEAVEAVTVSGRRELLPVDHVHYRAFVDPSGGSQDSFTLAIAHAENGTAVLDCVREVRPPFSPDRVVREFGDVLRSYGLASVTGDRYGGEWPAERFRVHGITYEPSAKAKSDLYRELLPLVNAGRAELLDNRVLRGQLIALERRVARGGRDSIDHAPNAHDDLANSVAGALVGVLPVRSGKYEAIFGSY